MKLNLLVFFILVSAFSWAQKIDNVYFRVDGKEVVVTYDLSGCESADVALFLSTNGGRSFSSLPLGAVMGDVGRKVKVGRKRIVWNPLGDYPEGITGDVAFKVKVMGNVVGQPVTPAAVPQHQSTDVERITVNGVSFDMIRVEGGTFMMGATAEQGEDATDYEKPAHQVTLSDYYIGKYEVTQRLWKAVMGNNPSKHQGDDFPVENVSWEDCQKFIAKLNNLMGKCFALPTEAQWEFAARGGNKSRGYKYSGSGNVGTVAWYNDNSGRETHRVGTKQANELGLYDMSGNVWEWCQDWFGNYSSASQMNPQGPSSGSFRVVRGGNSLCVAGICRVSDRFIYVPGDRFIYGGFRLVALF